MGLPNTTKFKGRRFGADTEGEGGKEGGKESVPRVQMNERKPLRGAA